MALRERRTQSGEVERTNGYLPLRDYALVGDCHTTALVGRDGSIDWLCVPRPDAPPVFDRLLDAEHGGCFELRPDEPFEAIRRYREGTNILETVFTSASGSVRVTDAMTRGDERVRELVRVVDARDGRVPMRWRYEPRHDFGRGAVPDELELDSWDAGEGVFTLDPGGRATFALHFGGGRRPRAQVERDLERTSAWWQDWSGCLRYDGLWRGAVSRSALVLKLMQYEPTGAIVAAPTTSLPERIGGDLNWDYRYSWLRDGIYTMRALLHLGYRQEAEAFFRWQLDATGGTAPDVRPVYRVDATPCAPEEEVDVPGYLGSEPVRVGNAAVDQRQLDNYGHVLESASRLHSEGRTLDPHEAKLLAGIADHVAASWKLPDAGVWERREGLHHFVQSKAMCWTALDRAAAMAEEGAFPDRRATWREAADAVRAWVEREGWDAKRRRYVRAPDLADDADASLLSLSLCAYSSATDERFAATVAALRDELSAGGPLLYRTSGSRECEGAFLTCSFWLVDALARAERTDEAGELMGALVALANDVGLYAEELDPDTGAFLGNFPQALVHLALVNAAVSLDRAD